MHVSSALRCSILKKQFVIFDSKIFKLIQLQSPPLPNLHKQMIGNIMKILTG